MAWQWIGCLPSGGRTGGGARPRAAAAAACTPPTARPTPPAGCPSTQVRGSPLMAVHGIGACSSSDGSLKRLPPRGGPARTGCPPTQLMRRSCRSAERCQAGASLLSRGAGAAQAPPKMLRLRSCISRPYFPLTKRHASLQDGMRTLAAMAPIPHPSRWWTISSCQRGGPIPSRAAEGGRWRDFASATWKAHQGP